MARSTSRLNLVGSFALLETPGGFTLFYIDNEVFKDPDGIWSYLTEPAKAELTLDAIKFVKIGDKSVTRRNDGPGKDLTKLIKEYCRGVKVLYVEDKKLRRVIYSNMKIKCCDDDYVVDELMWGLNNLAYDLVIEDRDNLCPGYDLSPPKGLMKCIRTFNIEIPAEAIDKDFIINAGGLYQCNAMLRTTREDLRESCERHVPGISELIKDDMDYAEVMAEILCPGLEPDWLASSSSSSNDTVNVWFAKVTYYVIVSVVLLGTISCLTNVPFDEAWRLILMAGMTLWAM